MTAFTTFHLLGKSHGRFQGLLLYKEKSHDRFQDLLINKSGSRDHFQGLLFISGEVMTLLPNKLKRP